MKHNYTGGAKKKNSAGFDQSGRCLPQFSLLLCSWRLRLIPFLISRDLHALMFPVTITYLFLAFLLSMETFLTCRSALLHFLKAADDQI